MNLAIEDQKKRFHQGETMQECVPTRVSLSLSAKPSILIAPACLIWVMLVHEKKVSFEQHFTDETQEV
jgi:hypothetical protein